MLQNDKNAITNIFVALQFFNSIEKTCSAQRVFFLSTVQILDAAARLSKYEQTKNEM